MAHDSKHLLGRAVLLGWLLMGRPAPAEPAPLYPPLLSDPALRPGFFCLWRAAGFGFRRVEAAAWILRTEDGALALEPWPLGARDLRERWPGPPPTNAVGILHTHPDLASPWPSDRDAATARLTGLPVSTVTRHGLFTVRPDGASVQEADEAWYAPFEGGRCDCSASRAKERAAAPGFTTTVAAAPAAGRGGRRSR